MTLTCPIAGEQAAGRDLLVANFRRGATGSVIHLRRPSVKPCSPACVLSHSWHTVGPDLQAT